MAVYEERSKIISEKEIDRASMEADEYGVEIPLKDGLGIDVFEKEDFDLPGELATDEEQEMPGMKRPPKGSGWWG